MSPIRSSAMPEPDHATASSGRTIQLGRAYAEHLLETQPEYFATLGVTVEDFAARFAAPGLTIDESVEAGGLSAAEGRYLQFRATREDLVVLGHAPEGIDAILAEQRDHACASSS